MALTLCPECQRWQIDGGMIVGAVAMVVGVFMMITMGARFGLFSLLGLIVFGMAYYRHKKL